LRSPSVGLQPCRTLFRKRNPVKLRWRALRRPGSTGTCGPQTGRRTGDSLRPGESPDWKTCEPGRIFR
jgi:hypothetical protein